MDLKLLLVFSCYNGAQGLIVKRPSYDIVIVCAKWGGGEEAVVYVAIVYIV